MHRARAGALFSTVSGLLEPGDLETRLPRLQIFGTRILGRDKRRTTTTSHRQCLLLLLLERRSFCFTPLRVGLEKGTRELALLVRFLSRKGTQERERERNRRRRFVIIDEYTCPDRREGGKNYNVLRTIVINENEILLPSLSKVQLGGIVKIPLLLLLSTWRACPSNPHELASSIDRSTSIL